MAKKGKKNAAREGQYSNYKTQSKYKKNRIAKLERHLKQYPNDAAAQAALKNVSDKPRRGTPKTSVWSSTARDVAQMLARVGINGNHALGGKASETIGDGEDKRFFGDAKYDKLQQKRWEEEERKAKAATKQKAKAA